MKKLIVCAAFAGLLAGCGQTTSVTAPAPDAPGPTVPVAEAPQPTVPTDAAAGPSGSDNMTWQFGNDGRTATGTARPRLMYASYGSEGLALNLQCDPDTNNAYAILWRGQQRAAWPFTLQSGAARTQLSGTGQGEGEVIVTAPVALNAAALAAFRTSGDLSLTADGATTVLDAINDTERQAIANFFEACS